MLIKFSSSAPASRIVKVRFSSSEDCGRSSFKLRSSFQFPARGLSSSVYIIEQYRDPTNFYSAKMITQIAPISHPYVTLIIVVSVFSSLSTVFVILRYCSRRLSGGFGLDDWTAVGALFFALGFLIANVLAATIGMAGYHQDQIDMAHYQAYTRVSPTSQCVRDFNNIYLSSAYWPTTSCTTPPSLSLNFPLF